jgi:putative transposase
VWSTDLTYIRLPRGFAYLVAVIDWYSRKVLAWRLSNTLDSEFCVEGLEQALQIYGTPEICNTDQGYQFSSEAFTGVLKSPSAWLGTGGIGQHLRGTTLAERQVRGRVSERVRHHAGITAGADGVCGG